MLSRSSGTLLRRLSRPSTLLLASSSLALVYVANNPSIAGTLTNLGSSHSRTMSSHQYPVQKSEEEWRLQLTPEQFRILRQAGTERPGTGEYNKHYPTKGTYNCAGCDTPLYTAESKFDSGCGWPAFFDAIPGALRAEVDRSFGTVREEILCANCGAHQGHTFRGERLTKENVRHCVNSVSIKYNENGTTPGGQKAKA
ncbi:peptide-methionine (R)-S-oxide reductase [Sporobolomyces koalae]|uniref:peptide-methionine (R)-S-oxide reductase n=1 Tax=Sporobolomyces koalae TaxID=500713 RepID=UPI00316C6FA1